MYYFLAFLGTVAASRALSGSWRKTFVLPWVIVTTPMLLGAALANLDLIPALIAPWSGKTHALVVSGTVALLAGSFTLRRVRGELSVVSNDVYWNERMLLRVLLFITAVALAANLTQFLIAGQIPIFSADPDHARMEASKNGYLHIFSVLSGHLVPIAALILFTGKNLCGRTRATLRAIIAINSVLLILWVARGMLIYPIVTVLAMDYLLDPKSFRPRKLFAVAVMFLVVVSGVKYLRDVMRFGPDYRSAQTRAGTGLERGLLGNATVLYLTVALNYEILNRYAAAVPLLAPHSNGRLMGGNLTAYLPGSGAPYTELNLQNAVLKKHEKDFTLTSTFFGIPYLDFGFPGVIVISFLVGRLYRTAWLGMIRKGSPWSIFLYGYLISMAAFIPYTFLFTQVSFTWFLMSCYPIIALSSCSGQGASLYRRESRIDFAGRLG